MICTLINGSQIQNIMGEIFLDKFISILMTNFMNRVTQANSGIARGGQWGWSALGSSKIAVIPIK